MRIDYLISRSIWNIYGLVKEESMKVYKIAKKIMLTSSFIAFLYGFNVYAENCLDCHSLIEKAANLEVIKSKIKGFGLEEKKDGLNSYHLKTVDYGECNYSIKDGRLLARRASYTWNRFISFLVYG